MNEEQELEVVVGVRWWVQPFIRCAAPFAWFMNDEQTEGLAEWTASVVARYGTWSRSRL